MKKNIIVKEVEKGHGIYVIDVDKSKAGQIKGSSYKEKLDNAIRDFLKSDGKTRDAGNYGVKPV